MAVAIGNETTQTTVGAAGSVDVVMPTHNEDDYVTVCFGNDGSNVIATPTDWTLIDEQTASAISVHGFYRKAPSGGISSPVNFNILSGSQEAAVYAAQITGADLTTFLSGTPVTSSASNAGTHTVDSMDTLDDNALVFHFAARDGGGGWTTVPATVEANLDQGSMGLAVSSGFLVSAGATGSKVFTLSASDNGLGMVFAIKPADAGAAPAYVDVLPQRIVRHSGRYV